MCLLLILLFFSGFSTAQDFRFEHYGIEQGLTQSSVTSITQDSRGFLWVATWDGLNRFDGYNFLNFKADPKDTGSLVANNIIRTYPFNDSTLMVWMAEGGFSFLNTKTLRFYKHIGFPSSGGDLYSYPVLAGETIYLNRKNEIIKISPPDFKESLFKKEATEILLKDRFNRFWEAGPVALNRLTENGEVAASYPGPAGAPYRFRASYDHFFCWLDDSTILYETEKAGLYILNEKSGTITPAHQYIQHPLIKEIRNVTMFFTDKAQRVWIGTFDGLYLIGRGMDRYTVSKYVHNPANPFSLHSNRVQTIFEDRTGIIWIGTTTGLHKIVPNKSVFRHFPPYNSSDQIPFVFLEEPDVLWWGTTNGLFRLNYKTGKTARYTAENSGLKISFVYYIYRDSVNGNLYLGTRKGLHVMEKSSTVIRHIPIDGIENLGIYTILPEKNNQLWLGTSAGLYLYNKQNQTFNRFRPDTSLLVIGGGTFLCGLKESDSTLLLGSDAEGLFRFNTRQQKFTGVWRIDSVNYVPGKNKIMYIHRDSRGILRCVSLGGGLHEMTPHKNSFNFKHYGREKGFNDESMYGILEDESGALWIPTNMGLSRYIPQTGEVYNFTTEDGLPSNEFNQNGFHKGTSGRMFFGTVGGSVSFYPEDISINPAPPALAFTKFLVKNEDFSALLSDTVITLAYNQNFFSFEFSSLSFESPSKNLYAYKLEGLDEDWVYSNHRRFANYTEVPPGNYTFRIRGSNSSGVWNDKGISISIIIVPPFWHTVWFRVLAAFMLVALISGIVIYFTRKKYKEQISILERQQELLEERQKIRDKIARDLHDDLASTVGGAGLYVESAKNKFHSNSALSLQYLDKTGSLLREAEDAMSDIVWSVSPKFDTLPNLVSRIHRLAGELCAAASIKYIPQIPVISEIPIAAEVRRNIYMIFKEGLHNAIRHSGAVTITFSVLQSNDMLTITLSDNGKGLPAEPAGQSKGGNGLGNMKKRAEDLSAELSFSQPEDGGLILTFCIELTRLGY